MAFKYGSKVNICIERGKESIQPYAKEMLRPCSPGKSDIWHIKIHVQSQRAKVTLDENHPQRGAKVAIGGKVIHIKSALSADPCLALA